jgi:competence protein ComEA
MKNRQVAVRLVAIALGLLLLAGLSVAQSGGSMGQSIPDKMPSMSQAKDLIDINSATKEQLSSLPGIGDKYSDKIIAGRPYANKSQLVSKKIIPEGVYSKISSMIIAKQK